MLKVRWRSLLSLSARQEAVRRRRMLRRRVQLALVLAVLFLAVSSYLTNPFTRFSLVEDPYQVEIANNQIVLTETKDLRLRENWLFRNFAWAKNGWHIFNNVYTRNRRAPQDELEPIIDNILAKRFDIERPFLISGDHFSVLYPRSLGIFYHSALDPRTARSDQDWTNRQKLYLKTVAYALDAFSNAPAATTTIVPVGRWSVALVNVYKPPSDTMYSLLHALSVLESPQTLNSLYTFGSTPSAQLMTAATTEDLELRHKATLKRLTQQYREFVQDPQTSLVRTDIEISSARDGIKRSSAFYDNVMLWRTLDLAKQHEVLDVSQGELDALKQTILATFWQTEQGFFLDELSPEAQENGWYSSDWLIAYQTGFLRPDSPDDREYLERALAHLQKEKLHLPFGVRYTNQQESDKLHLFVRVFAPDYMTTAIWSHWGMEYTKLLTALYQQTCSPAYLNDAWQQIAAYENNILEYRGYPELYNSRGDIYWRPFYRSVWQTGWVVNFLQAREMVEWTTQNSCKSTAQPSSAGSR